MKGWKDNLSLGLLITAVTFVATFYIEWRTDEASEDMEKETNKNIMFDNVADKVETKNLTNAVKPAAVQVKWAKDEMMQEKILEKMDEIDKANKKQDCLLIRLNDQYYQLNQKDIHIDN
jgi:Na+/phosphate symporter